MSDPVDECPKLKFSDLFSPDYMVPDAPVVTISLSEIQGEIDADELFGLREATLNTAHCDLPNYSSLLEKCSQWAYEESPLERVTAVGEGLETEFETRMQTGRYVGIARAADKMSSKNLAAKECLLKIVEGGEYRKYWIPGASKEEALKYLETVGTAKPKQKSLDDKVVDTDEEISRVTRENWGTRCVQLAKRKGLSQQPVISFSHTGEAHAPRFTCECILSEADLRTEVTMSTKKAAQAYAWREMATLMEALPDPPPPPQPEEPAEHEAADEVPKAPSDQA